jgi:hypothetical protein
MVGRLEICLLTVIVGLCVGAFSSPSAAQEYDALASLNQERDESLYYRQPTYRPNTRAIIHEKAQARAYQRQARLASLNWYGMSNGRPTAAPTPFMSLYSPTWQMPGGRPFAWHYHGWPAQVYYTR